MVCGGIGNVSQSYGEWVGGLYGTIYSPSSATGFSVNDRIFNVGNGSGSAYTSDALTILKNGLASLPSVTNLLIANGSGKVVLTKEFADANYIKFNSTPPQSVTSNGKAGEVRITPNFIYVCVSDNIWVRSVLSTTSW